LIQRFEFCFDLFWKSLKDHLEKSYGISVASPRAVFREVFGQGLLHENEYKLLEEMIGDRNDASHRYDQAMAESIAKNISSYCEVMVSVFDKHLSSGAS
jgi:nucleotidyltransferase substrate binding protein (TIGR01987 family)